MTQRETSTATASRRAPQIKDVARAAGVSTATVSRAFSNPDLLTEATRTAVFDAVEATGYRINTAARNLRKQSAGAVLVLVPNLANPFFSKILSGISAAFAKAETSVIITDTHHHNGQNRKLADYIIEGRVDGIVSLDGGLSADELRMLDQGGFSRRVTMACEWVEGARMPSVRSDNAKGAALAIGHLHALGHRRIAHVMGPEDNVLTIARAAATRKALADLGLQERPDWFIRGDFTLDAGKRAAAQIAGMQDRPTAVFCASDEIAFGVIAGLAQAGLRVPEDISVMGFDDIELSEHYLPALTTIRQDRPELGRVAAERLKAQIADPTAVLDKVIDLVDVTLVARDSTCPPAGT